MWRSQNMDAAAWAAWLDTLLAQGERMAACWGHFSWNRISGQVSWAPCPGAGPSPTMLRLKLGEMFPAQERGTRLGARLDHTQEMVPDLDLLLWWINLKCSSWKNFWRGIPLSLLPVAPTPLTPDLHHSGLSLVQDKSSFMCLSFCLNFLQPFPCIPIGTLLQSGLNHPRGSNIQPKTLGNWNSANKNWTSQHGHFSLLKGGLHYLLVAPEGQAGLLLSACFLI